MHLFVNLEEIKSLTITPILPQIIRDNNLNNHQVYKVISKLKKHWKGGFPSYVQEALRDRKRALDGLYRVVSELFKFWVRLGLIFAFQVKLDATTEHFFTEEVKGEEDRILTR